MRRRVLVVDRFAPPMADNADRYLPAGLELVKADARDEAAQLACVGEADYLIVTGVPLRARVIEAGTRLQLIQKLGVGVDKIDLAAAARCGVPVAITPGANMGSAAEAAVMFVLALMRRLRTADAGVRAGRWDQSTIASSISDLAGRTVGIIGLGRVGKQVARRLAAFDVHTLYYDLVRPGPEVEERLAVRFVPFDELLAESDVVTLHVPLTTLTRKMIDEQALARMRAGALLINTARGEVVDEAALERALRSGHLAGAGLDTFEAEPVAGPRPLFESPNVLLTPHVAGVTRDAVGRMWQHAYGNCLRLAAGEAIPPDDLVIDAVHAAGGSAPAALADHTVAIGEGWSLWRRFCVRGAGFPATDLMPLGLVDTHRHLEALLELDERLAAERTAARELAASAGALKAWRAAESKLLAGRPVAVDGLPAPLLDVLDRLTGLVARRQPLDSAARATFAGEQARVHADLAAIARTDRFREAVMWQNRGAAIRSIDPFREAGSMTERRRRQRERLVASYLQRYCAKADSIGFFGPTGWGRFDSAAPTAMQKPGPSLIARQTVYFEQWSIDALAQRIAELPGIRPWLAPRRVPAVRIDSELVAHFPDGRSTPLTALDARLLADCSGVLPARELAQRWCEAAPVELPDYGAVDRALHDLVARGLVFWTLEVAVGSPYPERNLRQLLEAIGDPTIRSAAVAMLDELETKRDAAARAAGDSSALALALDDADQTFTRLTGAASTRYGGKTYAGRTILYTDSERDLEVVFGPQLLASFADALRLLLWSARWFTYNVVSRFEALFRELLAKHAAETGRDEMDYLRFWQGVAPHVAGGSAVQTGLRSALVQDVEAELQRRWAQVLHLVPGSRRQDHSSAELDDRVRAMFAAPHGGVELLRHHAPDISVAARSIEAIKRGECSFVLSELHVAGNTFTRPCFFEQCTFTDELIAARRVDLPNPEVFPILKKDMHLNFSPATYKDTDLHFETADAKSWLPRERVYAIGELTVRSVDGRAMVCCARDRRQFAAADFFAFYLIRAAIQSFSIAPPQPHTPRITIDRLVVARECWRMTPAEIPFLEVTDEFDRLVAARRWTRSLGMPRFVFVKVPEERKPLYVDLESSIFLDLFQSMARKAKSVMISEMLPTIDDSWLADREDRRYVCELRLAAVDPAVGPSTTGS